MSSVPKTKLQRDANGPNHGTRTETMKKKNRTAKCGHTQPSTSIRTDRVVPPALREQYRNNGVGTQLPANLRQTLRRRDRWRVEDMLAEREQHSGISDIEIWRRLFLPNDLV